MITPEDVLGFWLDEVGPSGWYKSEEALDQEIRDRFGSAWSGAMEGRHALWLTYPSGTLAYIILLDQFPRNMFRGQATAFTTDKKAKSAACSALKQGWDERFPETVRQFFYLPFMHSEALTDQDHSVRLYCQKMPDSREDSLIHAVAHREIIRRFGRFPYRNVALGRISSSAEEEFLQGGGYGKMLDEARSAAVCK